MESLEENVMLSGNIPEGTFAHALLDEKCRFFVKRNLKIYEIPRENLAKYVPDVIEEDHHHQYSGQILDELVEAVLGNYCKYGSYLSKNTNDDVMNYRLIETKYPDRFTEIKDRLKREIDGLCEKSKRKIVWSGVDKAIKERGYTLAKSIIYPTLLEIYELVNSGKDIPILPFEGQKRLFAKWYLTVVDNFDLKPPKEEFVNPFDELKAQGVHFQSIAQKIFDFEKRFD